MQPRVIEIVEFIDDSDYEGDEEEIIEKVVTVPRHILNHSALHPYEVGIGEQPPPFLRQNDREEWANQLMAAAISSAQVPVEKQHQFLEETDRSYEDEEWWKTDEDDKAAADLLVESSHAPKSAAIETATSSYTSTAATPTTTATAVSQPKVHTEEKKSGSVSPPPLRNPDKGRRASKRLSTKKHLSIVNNALGLEEEEGISDYSEEEIIEEEEEEVIEEEIIEEEYSEEEVIEEEEYYEEEIIESEQEKKERQHLEAEIARIEEEMAEAKAAKESRVADGEEHIETAAEKAKRMAATSRLQACKDQEAKLTFKQKAAVRAKILAEKEKNWGKKGKKKEKSLSDIIAGKAKKQGKLLSRQKSRDYAKAGIPLKPPTKVAKKIEEPAKQEETTPVEEKQPLSMADMLMKKQQLGREGMPQMKVKAPDVQLRAADDFGDDDLRPEDFLPSDSEDEEEEAEPELTEEERHKKSLEWEKPSWTQAKLKTTVKGTQVKKGKTLAAPITFIPKKINEGLEDEDQEDAPSQGALMKGALKMVALPKVKKHQAGLKFTGNGARIRDGRKIEKQIYPKISNKEEEKIWGADPEELKLTPRGLNARKGKTLAEENITQATQTKKYAFEKPEWAKYNKDLLLKGTETGEQLKEGADIAPVITAATVEKKHTFEKPDWAKGTKLKSTDAGSKLKSGAYLSKPIVILDKKTINVNREANPAFLRMTEQGDKLMEEGNLAAPITEAPQLAKQNQAKRYGDHS